MYNFVFGSFQKQCKGKREVNKWDTVGWSGLFKDTVSASSSCSDRQGGWDDLLLPVLFLELEEQKNKPTANTKSMMQRGSGFAQEGKGIDEHMMLKGFDLGRQKGRRDG